MTRLVTLVVLVVGAWFTLSDQITYGEFVSFVLFVNVLIKPVDKITALLELYPKGMAGFKRFTELIDQDPEVQNLPHAKPAPLLKGDIQFNDVSFGYDSHKKVLESINLSIPAGQTVAFVGPSGAGKTTICSLIPRFYDVNEGEISIDGIPIQDMTTESLRHQIGIVQQDVFLFTGTIRDADRVVVVTENGIEEQGTYDELVAQGGVFATLHNSQFRESKLGITKE